MSWLLIIPLVAVSFAIAVFALRLPRLTWPVFAAALMFGLAGYALQGSPAMPSAPKERVYLPDQTYEVMIESRRILFGRESAPSRYVIIADGFARRGQFEDAAGMLNNAVAEDAEDVEAWVALGNALVEHADGVLTPAASYAYTRAELLDADNPALAYFSGAALIRMGRPVEAHAVWKRLIDTAPQDAEWLPLVKIQYDRLDGFLSQMAQQETR